MDFWSRAARTFKMLNVRCEIVGEEVGMTQSVLLGMNNKVLTF
jgi:hypothetical protein